MGGMRNLCEAIILQSMEDLLAQYAVEENRAFLTGEGMDVCGEIAGLGSSERQKLSHFAMTRHPVLGEEEKETLRLTVNA